MNIREYRKVTDIAEAYELLQKVKTNRIIAGCTFMQRTKMNINVAIDLEKCGLDYIVEEDECVRIGAMTSLRELEQSSIMLENFGTALNDILKHLIGVQLRNMITIGAHLYSRFGFSDILTLFLTMDAELNFYNYGKISLVEFTQNGLGKKRDILTEIIIPKKNLKFKVAMMRKSYNDYSVLCTAVSKSPENQWILSSGARPMRAELAINAMKLLNEGKITYEMISEFCEQIAEEFQFGTNYRGTAEYRKELCKIYFRRMIEELWNEN